jgi:hypothetical protein
MQKQKTDTVIRDITVIAFLLFGGGYFIYIAAHGFLTDQVSTMGRDSPWFSHKDYPNLFWVSIVFHTSAGLYAILTGVRMLKRVFNLEIKKK